MAYGKRDSTAEPLTEHDLAERMGKAAERLLRIMMDLRQIEGVDGEGHTLMRQVRDSRYLPAGLLQALGHEIVHEWGVEPRELPGMWSPAPPSKTP